MGNDKIEPKPEPALLTNILDEVCVTEIDDGNLSSPTVATQDDDIKDTENAENTFEKTNGDVYHIDPNSRSMEGGPAPSNILPVNKPDDPNFEVETSVPVKQVLATEI